MIKSIFKKIHKKHEFTIEKKLSLLSTIDQHEF